MSASEVTRKKIHPSLARSYWARAFAYAAASLLMLPQIPANQPWAQYVLLGIGFLFPTLFYHLGLRARDTRLVGFAGYYLDAVLWATAVVYSHYSIVLLLLAPMLAFVSSVLMLGMLRALPPAAIMLAILITGQYFVPFAPLEGFSIEQGILGWAMLMVFMIYIALLVNGTTRSFVAAKHELQEGNAKIKEQTEQLASLTYVAQLVNSTLDLDQVMNTIMRSLNQVFSFTLMAILFVDEGRNKLALDRMVGDISPDLLDDLEGLDIPLDEKNSAFARTVVEAQPIYLPDVSVDPGASEGVSRLIYQLIPAKSLLTFPLRQDGAVEGVLAFANTRSYIDLDEENIREIGRYVTYVVSAIRNAKNFRAIQEARSIADTANVAKSQFLANMSHELRTPMNAVIGYTEMLQEEAEDRGLDDMIPDFQKIRSASHHLLQLINDVLDLSKIEADRIELSPEVLSVDELLADVKTNVEPLIAKNRNALKITTRSKLGDVFLDRVRLHQVVLNLLSNAAKFTRRGTVEVTADRLTDADHDWLIIEVRDSGIGMTEEQLERVFEPFAQADASTTREFGGTGLGLSISRQICELMGGSLSATSEKDKGSIFTVRIPVESSGIRVGIGPQPEAAAKQSNASEPAEQRKVLVIDDDASIRDLMSRTLEREGYSVVTASSGEQGLELAARIRPAVIVLDVMLPSLDGWSVLTRLKSNPELADIPVVMQSILDESNKGFMLGASEYLTKPIDRKRVLEVITRLQRGDDHRALVVEDDADTRNIMASWLENAGWQVSTADDGAQGLEAWNSNPADLIILDLLMPNMDGFEFMEALRQSPGSADTRVVVVTAKDLNKSDIEKLGGSVERIIQKSSRPTDEILREIGRHLAA
jgi:signal transduction histidine kinase/CheY-like chemotaxis protein